MSKKICKANATCFFPAGRDAVALYHNVEDNREALVVRCRVTPKLIKFIQYIDHKPTGLTYQTKRDATIVLVAMGKLLFKGCDRHWVGGGREGMIVMDTHPIVMYTPTPLEYYEYEDRVYKLVMKDGVRHLIHLTDEELEVYNGLTTP
jgi:hypothetical protein